MPGSAGEIDWDDIHLRVDAGRQHLGRFGRDLAERRTDRLPPLRQRRRPVGGQRERSSLTRVTHSGQAPKNIRWSRKSSGLIYFLDGSGEFRSTRAAGAFGVSIGGLTSEPMRINFQAKMTVKRDEEFAEMFEQCWRALSDSFYDPQYHGANWEAVRDKYQPLVGHVAQQEDLYALVSLMLGELNASHLGISGRLPTADEQTADLGLIFDETYRGPGLKIGRS